MQPWYEIKAKGAKSAEIFIFGDIGESWYEDSVTAKRFVAEISELSVDELTIRINSYGGSVSDGIAIYNAIKRCNAKTTISIEGVAVSIASLIAMAGDSVQMAENALMMVHAPWWYAGGNAQDLREAADVLDKYAAAMASSYTQKTGKTTEAVLSWLTDGADHWFTAAEALAENLIDTITPAQNVAAHASLNRFNTLPAAAGIFIKPASELPMPQPTNPQAAEAPPAAPAVPQPQAAIEQPNAQEIEQRVLAAEHSRRHDIRARFTPFAHLAGVQDLLNTCLDDSKISAQAAADKLMNKLGENMEPSAGAYTHRIETGETDVQKFARAASQAILARVGAEKHDPANEFRGLRLEDMARASLEKAGFKTKGMDRLAMVKAALSMRPSASSFGQTTSDFPVLLESVMHRQVLTAYQSVPDTWSQICKIGDVSDFREWQRLSAGSIGDIDDVLESGEYKQRNIPDLAKEGISAQRRGNIISITPEVIINDDIGYISDTANALGRAAKRTIENKFYALLVSNPVLKNGTAVFHSSRTNIAASGGAPSVDTLEAGSIAMAQQRDISGNEILDIQPAIWLGPIGLRGNTNVIVNAQYDPDTPNKMQRPNKANGLVRDIIGTARLTGTAWYLFADPNIAPVFEVVFLDGQREPILALEDDFRTAGISYRVELPFGIGAIGYVGGYYNAGA